MASAAPARLPREALRYAHTPRKWLAAEEGAQEPLRLCALHFPTLRARKQMPLCGRRITNAYAAIATPDASETPAGEV